MEPTRYNRDHTTVTGIIKQLTIVKFFSTINFTKLMSISIKLNTTY